MNERTYSKEIERLRYPERLERIEPEKVVSLCLKNNAAKSVLDIGTGSGIFAEEFFKRGLSVAGIDINNEMIPAAKSYVPEGTFVQAPAESIPFGDNTFDLAFMGVVFHEADDYTKALSESFRVCKIATCLLEWKYCEEEIGPPIEHRLKEDEIREYAQTAGFKSFNVYNLTRLVLYELMK